MAMTMPVTMPVVIAASVVVRIAMFLVLAVVVPVVVVLFVLAIMVAVIVPVFLAHVIAVETMLPTTVPSPVGALAALGEGSAVAKSRVEVAVNVAAETLWTMKPRTGTDEYAGRKPRRTIVAKRSTPVWRIVEVAVRADRLRSYLDIDAHLSTRTRRANSQAHRCNRWQNKKSELLHRSSLLLERGMRSSASPATLAW